MNLLWAANYASQSGYANQTRMFVKAVQSAGHNISVLELAQGTRTPQLIDGIQILPTALDPLGSDILVGHAQKMKSHAVISLIDVWGMNKDVMKQVPWYPMTPCDTLPPAPAVLDHLQSARRPIAISQYGYNELVKAGLKPLFWPHAVNPAVFQPYDRAASRKQLNIPQDAFLVSFCGVNDSAVLSRKGIPEMLAAWQLFSADRPDVILYLHTSESGNLGVSQFGGVRINKIAESLRLRPDSVRIVDPYRYRTGIPQSELATLWSASDVCILLTVGEGFGLPLLEAQRCGCPVITTDVCTGPELCFSGWLVEGEPVWGWQDAWIKKAGITAAVEALETCYAERGTPQAQARRAKALEWAREYDLEIVMSRYGLPVLQQIAYETM